MEVAGGSGVGGGATTLNVPGETCTSGEYTQPLLSGAPANSIWIQSPPGDLPKAGAVEPVGNVPTTGKMEALGPIRTLICGSSVITVIYIPSSAAGVAVSCRASTTGEMGAKKFPKIIKAINMVKMAG